MYMRIYIYTHMLYVNLKSTHALLYAVCACLRVYTRMRVGGKRRDLWHFRLAAQNLIRE